MPFQVSPGVNVSEIDLTTVVPAVSTTEGALAGVFSWGPVEQRILIESEDELVQRFGKPTDANFETFFTAANFLAYGNKLYVVRAANTSLSISSIANTGAATANSTNSIKNRDDYESRTVFDANVAFIAKCPGDLGNSLRISVCDSAKGFETSLFNTTTTGANGSAISIALPSGSSIANVVTSNTADATTVSNILKKGTVLRLGNTTVGFQEFKLNNNSAVVGSNVSLVFTAPSRLVANLATASTNSTSNTAATVYWEFFKNVDTAPGTSAYTVARAGTGDEVHVVVADEDGIVTGNPGSILEVFPNLSRATDAVAADGTSIYYKNVLKEQSNYVWAATGVGVNGLAATLTASNTFPTVVSFVGGASGESEANVSTSVEIAAYSRFISSEDLDISLVLTGRSTNTAVKANYIIDNICEVRKDCVAFISPHRAATVNNIGEITADLIAFRNAITSTSYAMIDSGYKYMYDKYNDTYRYVPLNGDIAGLVVRTDNVRDPWYSPAGLNRGIIKNVVKLAYNPSKADRDVLYKVGINPVVTFPGQGTLLYGDKTALTKPSAFDRINVRRLFITLEKAIATAAKYTLFEFNDTFTRSQFRNLIEPFLRDIQGRRGIYDFRVVCDETNNTPEIIDRNEFVGDIYIKPARSINYIQLNFVAVRTGVEFSEIVGQAT
jgi:phage tail sheath protein FI